MLGLGRNNLHSTLVVWAKIILPLVALVVLSTLFMVSHPVSPEDAIPYADVNVEARMREQQVTAPAYTGMTEDGSVVTMNADAATPGLPGTKTAGQATGVAGRIETPDGVISRVKSATATLDQANNLALLAGGVTLSNTAGYQIQTDSMIMALDRTRLESAGSVTAEAPFGTITAGKFVLTADAEGLYKLDFTGGVHLLYQPASSK